MRVRTVLLAVILSGGGICLAAGKNLVTNPGFEQGAEGWVKFGTGFEVDSRTAHEGKASIRCEATDEKAVATAQQIIQVNQKRPDPLLVVGWSKAEGVSGRPNANYSIYCDVEYTTDTRPDRVDLPGQVATFPTGTHDWVRAEAVIVPEAPIKEVTLYAMFRRHSGRAWFDDIFAGPLSNGPLVGKAAELQGFPADRIPAEAAKAAAPLKDEEFLLYAAQEHTQPYHRDPTRLFVGSEQVSTALVVRPWVFPRTFIPFPAEAPFAGVWLRRVGGDESLILRTQGKEGAAYRYTVILPKGISIRSVDFKEWEGLTDEVQVGRVGERAVVSVLTDVRDDADQVVFHVAGESSRPLPHSVAKRAEVTRHALKTADGLELDLASNGGLDGLRVGERNLVSDRNQVSGAGFHVGDLFGEGLQPVGGAVTQDGDSLRQHAVLGDLGLNFTANWNSYPDRIGVTCVVKDTTGLNRAVDVLLRLPVALKGWEWWEDIGTKKPIAVPIASSIYPWATITSPAAGLTLAIPPDSPCNFQFVADSEAALFDVRVKLGLSTRSKASGVGAFSLCLFRTDAAWGFRDAARRYYAAFPDAFRKIARKEGGWLFAFPPAKLPNPEDYAYHEGGPKGWELDQKLGILMCPYRIPTQRQIIFPQLPPDDESARAEIARLTSAPLGASASPAEVHKHDYAVMMQTSAAWNPDGQPYIVRRDNVGADIKPKNPIYNVVYAVNPDPDLFADKDVLTVGKYEMTEIEKMVHETPALGGIYLDSICGWISRYLNYREEHFACMDCPLAYDESNGRPCAIGWTHTYKFMRRLQERLSPEGHVVFPNIGGRRILPFLYFASDVIGLEYGIRSGDYESQMNFYRTMAYQKPVLIMDYIEVLGQPTRVGTREGFERHWKWCALFGAHPSIGRYCDKAWAMYPDVYRRFREPIRRIAAAGWEPVTYARTNHSGIRVERFGDGKRGLYFTVMNVSSEAVEVSLEPDAQALGLPQGVQARDLLSDLAISSPLRFSLAAGDLRILQMSLP